MNLSFKVPQRIVAIADHPFTQDWAPDNSEPGANDCNTEAEVIDADQEESGEVEGVSPENAFNEAVESKARQRAEELADEKIKDLANMVKQATQEIERFKDELRKDFEIAALRLAYQMARKIVRKEIQFSPDIVLYTVRDVLQRAGDAIQITLLCHPDDLDLLKKDHEITHWLESREKNYMLRPDAKVERGGCILETEKGTFDANIETQLAEIEKQVLPF